MEKSVKIFINLAVLLAVIVIFPLTPALSFNKKFSTDYSHQWISQSVYPTLAQGQSNNFQVTVRNTGSETWQRGSVNLGTSRDRDRISRFTREGDGPSGWISSNRVWFQESSVAPGATATFSFWMRNDSLSPGTYREYFCLVADGIAWMEDYGIYWDVLVPTEAQKYRHSWVSQSVYPSLYVEQSNNLQLTVRNTGVATWHKGAVNLGTDRDLDRISSFTREGDGPSGWLSPNRIMFQESSVAPGATATFSFWIRNDGLSVGNHREYFRLVADGITWMEDYGIYWDVTTLSGSAPTPTPTPSPTPQPGHCLNMSNYADPPTINNFPYDTTSDAENTFSSPEREPSGVIYVPDFDSIFMASDGGIITRLTENLIFQNQWTVAGDLEGITYDPATNKIYIAHEWPRQLDEYVFNPATEDFTYQRGWDLSGVFSCSASNSCIEGVTFVPDTNDEGGVFYVGKQEDGTITKIEVPLITEPAFDPRTYGASPVIDPPSGISTDISDLYYKEESELVYAIFDSSDRMSVLNPDTDLWIKHFYLPSHHVAGASENEEGITFDSNCAIHIGEDIIGGNTYGRVRRFDQ